METHQALWSLAVWVILLVIVGIAIGGCFKKNKKGKETGKRHLPSFISRFRWPK